MDPKENYEFLDKRKRQTQKFLQKKDSQLDCLNQRVEETCQSELEQVTTDMIHHQNSQNQQIQKTTSQFEELNVTTYLNENYNESKFQSLTTKFAHKKSVNKSNKFFEQPDFDTSQSRSKQLQSKIEEINKSAQIGNFDLKKSTEQSKEMVFLSKIKNKMKKFYREKTDAGKSFNLQNPKLRILINDKSDILERENNFFQKYCHLIDSLTQIIYQKINNKIPLFNPQSSLKFGLDIIFSIVNCVFFFYSSIIIVFGVSQEFDQQIYQSMYWMWSFQVIVKLNTSFYEKTNLIKNRKAIAKFYLKNHAIWDLLAFLLIFVQPQYTKARKVFKILQFFKLINVAKKLNDIQISICMSYQNYYILQLFKLVFKIFIIAHIIACLWYLVGYVELEYLGEETTWFDDSIAVDRHWLKLYICALYWSLTLMTTGSNTAVTALQISFTSLIMLITTIIFGYLLNIIGIILSEVDQEEENQRRDINQINSYMRKRQISKNLQREINLDLEYYYDHNFKKDDDKNNIVLSKISENLFQNLKIEYFGKYLNKIEIISSLFSQETQQKLLLQMEEQNYLPGQIITNYQNFDESRLIYIIQGQVEVIRQQSNNLGIQFVTDTYGKDKVMGEIAFFQGKQDGITIKAVDFTQILSIPRDKFLEIVKQNDFDLQTFCSIKDKISLYQDLSDIQIKCQFCSHFTHQQYDCPLLHFDKQNQKIKINYQVNFQQVRQTYDRKSRLQCNALMQQQDIENTYKFFNMNCCFQDILISPRFYYNQESLAGDFATSEKDIDFHRYYTKSNKSQSQIKYDEEDVKPSSQEMIKKRGKMMIKKKLQQQVCINIDSSSSSSNLHDENDPSDQSQRDRFQRETSIMSKLMEGSVQTALQNQQNLNQLNIQSYIKIMTQQCIQQFSKFENLLKIFADQQQMTIGKQLNQSTQKEVTQNLNNDNILLTFDQKKDYIIYFPNGNCEKILYKYNQGIKKRRKTMRHQKRKKI